MREIRIYGKLAKFLKRRVFHAEVGSVAEAIRFLVTNFPQVEAHMMEQHYRVSLDSSDVELDEIHYPVGQETIKIIPVIAGAGAVGRIIAGVALVAGALLIGQPWLGAYAFSAIIGVGASLALGGVSQLLTPVPATPTGPDSPDDPRKSYSFSSCQNTSRSGTPVPIVYGEMIVGSVVISSGIDISQVSA